MPRAALSKISVTQLVAELQKRQSKLAEMIVRRDALEVEIQELQGLDASAATAAPAQPRKGARAASRRATGKPLAEYVKEALAAATQGLSIADLEKKVLAAGYSTSVERIYKQISTVLVKGGFKRIARGVYALKAAAKAGKKAAIDAMADKPAAKGRKRGVFSETAEQFLLALANGKGTSGSDINKAWTAAGRGGRADQSLSKLVKAGKLQREKINGAKGSVYTAA